MEYKTIIFQIEDALATLTFNRPKALNAISIELLKEFSYILDEIAANETIRVLVLTGSGEKAFVAGADITELAKLNALQAKNFSAQGQRTINKLQNLSIPVIAAVNGYALGGGTEIALASDFIYASDNAVFGLPEITLGLIPGFGGTQRLSRLIGLNRAKEMIFTGKMIKADEAQTIGMVNKVCLPDKLWEEAIKTAKIIAGKGAVSLRAAKQVINNGVNADLITGCQMETDAFALCMASEDAYEGTHAFLAKRSPKFKGRLFYT
ncbi:enoyl-CoA hydratase-related protein [Desulfococcaceae bacterium HSG7]|nr:enoyl-CoA hydratase-related protein [Desulfococcaceae bacterium HSG9]MDM8554757.1 enoyl-CoA hydratase-related protein [Desulfococcaceae bacterium HSG7]